jgi:hypothetical protein
MHETQKDLHTMVKILTFVVIGQAIGLLLALGWIGVSILPKVERITSTAERLEARFQSFAEKVEPVIATGAAKAVESIRQIDSHVVGEKLTEGVSETVDGAKGRLKRILDGDQKKGSTDK